MNINKKLSSVIKTNNEQTIFIWYPNIIIEDLKTKNIYGYCKTKDNKIVLVRDKDETRFTLPRGGVQKGESPEEALIREFKKEAQFISLRGEFVRTRPRQGQLVV